MSLFGLPSGVGFGCRYITLFMVLGNLLVTRVTESRIGCEVFLTTPRVARLYIVDELALWIHGRYCRYFAF